MMTPERFAEINERGVIPGDPQERADYMNLLLAARKKKRALAASAAAIATKRARYNAWPGAANTHRTLRGDGTCPPTPTNR